jgi:hypothetical protein
MCFSVRSFGCALFAKKSHDVARFGYTALAKQVSGFTFQIYEKGGYSLDRNCKM